MPVLLVLIYPFAEIYAFFRFIDAYSFLDAVFFVFLSSLLGVSILVIQGKAALQGLQASLKEGKIPTHEILHRFIILLGGLLLFIPGIISDIIGILCILPISRHLIVWYLKLSWFKGIAQGRFKIFQFGQGRNGNEPRHERDATVLDITPIKIIHENRNNDSGQ